MGLAFLMILSKIKSILIVRMLRMKWVLFRAPEIILSRKYNSRTNCWHFGYVFYLLTSLKFNFQRANVKELEQLSMYFNKVLERSKIRTLFQGPIFDTIYNLLQSEPEKRLTFGINTIIFR